MALEGNAQEQKPGQPKFETSAELVLVDVTVISSNGEPVTGLTGNDFKLTVNGQPRPVHTAQFISSREIKTVAESPRLAKVSSNEAPSTGRLLLFVIDENYLRIGAARAVLRTAERVMNSLAPGDLVGLTRLPTGRGGVDFTTNRERIRAALSGVLGAQPSRSTDRVRLSEAHALDMGDRNTWEQVLQRECGSGFENRSTDGAATREACVNEVDAQARSILMDARSRSRVSISAFEQLTQRLTTLKAPVNVIVISEGLYLGRNGAGDLSHFARLAASARITFHIVQPDQSMFDTDGPRPVGTAYSESFLAEGLEQIAGMTRGSYFKVATSGDGAFDRIARELSGYYLLSFEPTEADRTSRDRRIKVEVDRRGLTVKARSTYALADASDAKDVASMSPEEQIKNLLVAPLPSAGLPIRVASYSVTSPEANRVRVVIAAEIGEPANNSVEWPVGVLVLNSDNKIFVDSTRYMTLEPLTNRAPLPRMLTMTMVLEPGEYSLRVAAIDHEGKSGSVHHTIDARLHRLRGDAVRASDLMISPDLADGGLPRPIPTAVHHSETMYSILELSGDMGRVGKSRVTVQVADSETAPALVSVDAQPLRPTQQGHRSFAALLKLGVLPPGEYVARAVVKVPGEPDAIVARPFRLEAVAAGAEEPARVAPRSVDDAPAPLPAAKVAAPVARFSIDDVLKPDVVRPFLEYLQREHPISTENAAVVQEALAGKFANLPNEGKAAGKDDVTLAFIRGLAQLQKKQYAQAAGWFQIALKGASDFLGAAFYLGAVHAAAGRDTDAIGAWQMATIGDNSDAVYPMLVDALLRVGDAQAALETLADAPGAWASADERLKRAATAQAMLGQFGPALESLTGLLERSPNDQNLLFVAIQVLYRQHLAKPLSKEDRARFDNYSKRYLDAKGPEAALVQTWRRYVMK